jgi:hypothetical protein
LRTKAKQNKIPDKKNHKLNYDEVPLDSEITNIEIPDEGKKHKKA